jgi:hypothetical protein
VGVGGGRARGKGQRLGACCAWHDPWAQRWRAEQGGGQGSMGGDGSSGRPSRPLQALQPRLSGPAEGHASHAIGVLRRPILAYRSEGFRGGANRRLVGGTRCRGNWRRCLFCLLPCQSVSVCHAGRCEDARSGVGSERQGCGVTRSCRDTPLALWFRTSASTVVKSIDGTISACPSGDDTNGRQDVEMAKDGLGSWKPPLSASGDELERTWRTERVQVKLTGHADVEGGSSRMSKMGRHDGHPQTGGKKDLRRIKVGRSVAATSGPLAGRYCLTPSRCRLPPLKGEGWIQSTGRGVRASTSLVPACHFPLHFIFHAQEHPDGSLEEAKQTWKLCLQSRLERAEKPTESH